MRLFLAVLLEESVRRSLIHVEQALRAVSVRGRFPPPANLHLTLAFLGETPKEAVPTIKQCMQNAVHCSGGPLTLTFDRLGQFRQRDGALCWIGTAPSPALMGLQRSLANALAQADIPFDQKPFRPHITLGRGVALRPGASLAAIPCAVAPLTVSSIALMESKRAGSALVYTPLHRAQLS